MTTDTNSFTESIETHLKPLYRELYRLRIYCENVLAFVCPRVRETGKVYSNSVAENDFDQNNNSSVGQCTSDSGYENDIEQLEEEYYAKDASPDEILDGDKINTQTNSESAQDEGIKTTIQDFIRQVRQLSQRDEPDVIATSYAEEENLNSTGVNRRGKQSSSNQNTRERLA